MGFRHQLFDEIQGRRLDFYILLMVRKFIIRSYLKVLVCRYPLAIVQNQLNEIVLNLQVDKKLYKLGRYYQVLRDEFLHKLGTGTKLIIEHVDEIPRETSGKFRMIKNIVSKIYRNKFRQEKSCVFLVMDL